MQLPRPKSIIAQHRPFCSWREQAGDAGFCQLGAAPCAGPRPKGAKKTWCRPRFRSRPSNDKELRSRLLIAEPDHIAIHGVFGHLPPQILVGPESGKVVIELFEPL